MEKSVHVIQHTFVIVKVVIVGLTKDSFSNGCEKFFLVISRVVLLSVIVN